MSRAALLLLLASCVSTELSPEADRFLDATRPPQQRLEALVAMRAADPASRHAVYARLREALRAEVARLDGLSLSTVEERTAAASLEWLAEEKDDLARLKMELHLDRDSAKRKRLPDGVLAAAALGLGRYPERESARDILWAALRDPAEADVVRSSAMKALQAHHPRDLEEKILALPAGPSDAWLRDLQQRLK